MRKTQKERRDNKVIDLGSEDRIKLIYLQSGIEVKKLRIQNMQLQIQLEQAGLKEMGEELQREAKKIEETYNIKLSEWEYDAINNTARRIEVE